MDRYASGECGRSSKVEYTSNVSLNEKKYEHTWPYAGFVGKNESGGKIENIEMNGDFKMDDPPENAVGSSGQTEESIPDPEEGETEEEELEYEDEMLSLPVSEEKEADEQNEETESGNTDEIVNELDVPERVEPEEDSEDIPEPTV